MTNFARLLIKGLAPIIAITVTAFCNVCFADHARWDPDWDERHTKYEEARNDKSREGIDTYEGFRSIYLIRPGQTDLNDCKRLSPLGKQQAIAAGKRLRHLRFKCQYDNLFFPSNCTKSAQTARIISHYLPGTNKSACDLIHNGYPIKSEPAVDFHPESDNQVINDGIRFETAFRKYFYRPGVGEVNSYEIMVCPTNVIRYFVCRALQLPPEGWERMTLFNGSITCIQIDADGGVWAESINNFSHLPEDKITPALIEEH